MYKKILFLFLCIFICTEGMAGEPSKVSLSVYKEKEEWNFVNTRLYLKNESDLPIQNPVVTYFAKYDYNLTGAVDYSSWPLQASIATEPSGLYTKVNVSVSGLLMPGKTQQIDIRLFHNNWNALDTKNDWSYQSKTRTLETAYTWAVRDASGSLLWGMDPVSQESSTDVAFWQNNDGVTVIAKYNGENESVGANHRFWLLKESALSVKEREILEGLGVVSHSAYSYDDKIVYLMTSNGAVSKQVLNESLYAFYNAFDVTPGDVSKLVINDEDNYETVQVCDNDGNCENQVRVRDAFDLVASCWEDVTQAQCIQMVSDCGGQIATADGKDVYATINRNSVSCLENSSMTRSVHLPKNDQPTNDAARQDIALNQVQYNFVADLSSGFTSQDWIDEKSYTGKGIVIGIYDTGIDFDHPFFREYANANDKVGVSREASEDELHFENAVAKLNSLNQKTTSAGSHGTHVAGSAAGNGNGTPNLMFRGVAPKAHLLSFGMVYNHQVGDVVSHSHVMGFDGLYNDEAYSVDKHIFNNWKDDADGDTVTKAFVHAAGNQGWNNDRQGYHKGYYSLNASAKNEITVGMYSSVSGLRHTGSSMGPTWDGRIKPDIMAPGSELVMTFDAANPFKADIDYIKIRRNGQLVFSEDFSAYTEKIVSGKNENLDRVVPIGLGSDVSNWGVQQVGSEKVLHIEQANDLRDATYLITRLHKNNYFDIKYGDEIEIKTRYTGAKSLPHNYLEFKLYLGWSETDDFYEKKNEQDQFDFSMTNVFFETVPGAFTNDFVTARFKWNGGSHNTVSYMRFDYGFATNQISSVPCPEGSQDVVDGKDSPYYDKQACLASFSGTSMAAPVVAGVVALMQQEHRTMQKDRKEKTAMRNSTIKGILIHTAEDMESQRDAFMNNPDLTAVYNNGNIFGPNVHFTSHGKGPDFATGWGKVNAKKALDVVSEGRFKEIEIKDKMEKRWNIFVTDASNGHLRTTLTWDDAPGRVDEGYSDIMFTKNKLVNDLDMYLVSPSGRMYYPWRLEPLPTKYYPLKLKAEEGETEEELAQRQADSDAKRESGIEEIYEEDIHDAINTCTDNDRLAKSCFDHRNNVEVVDVENPELGMWQIVVRGTKVAKYNNEANDAQIASLVSDFTIRNQGDGCEITHPYVPNQRIACEYDLGKNLKSYVTFASVFSETAGTTYAGPKTYLGDGDEIKLYSDNNLIGTYHGNELSGKTIPVSGKKLKVVLNSDNDSNVGWGFKVQRIRTIPLTVVPLLLGR